MKIDFVKLYFMIITSITFGYVIAGIFTQTKFINWIGVKTVKLSRFGIHPLLSHLPIIYLVSPRAAHIHASDLLEKRKIKPTDLYLTIAATNFPMRITFLYRYYFPVLIPLIGTLAVYYGLLRLLFDLIVFLSVMLIGRKLYRNLRKEEIVPEKVNVELNFSTIKTGFTTGIKESGKFLIKFTPLFAFVIYLITHGIMDKVLTVMEPTLKAIGLDNLCATYVATATISPPVAYGLIKIMIAKNYPLTKILGTMFIGNACFTFLRAWWAYVLPYYFGLYPLRIIAVLITIQSFIPATYNLIMGVMLVKFS